MRMRRKKHLDERLDACLDVMIDYEIEYYNPTLFNKNRACFSCEEVFKNSNPVHVEIGCGKGEFVVESAKRNPSVNYIAVEKLKNVIVDAAEKVVSSGVENIRLINCPAEHLKGYFPDGSVSRLYLNFSCPYPKKSYAKHRLTHKSFLEIYKSFLEKDGEIHIKTDNSGLFEFSLNSLSDFGFTLKNITFDLHKSDFVGNIVTEYEKKFTDAGFPIFRTEAYFRK